MTSEKVDIVRRELAQLFRHAYHGRASASLAYEIGESLKSRLEDIPEKELPEDMRDAFDFLHGLHDRGARDYSSKNREEFYHYMRTLSR